MQIHMMGASCLALFAAATLCSAADPVVGADLGFKSRYVWRGLSFNDDKVFWPDVYVAFNGLTVTGFLSMDMTNSNSGTYGRNYQSEVTDGDIFVDFTKALGPVSASIGVNQYFFPGYAEFYGPATEPYVKLAAILPLQVTPSLTFNADIPNDNTDLLGVYVSPKLSWTNTIGTATPTIAVSLGYASAGHNEFFAAVPDAAGIQDITTTLSALIAPPAPLADNAAITLDCGYSFLLNKKLKDAGSDDTHIWAGVTVNLFKTISCAKEQ